MLEDKENVNESPIDNDITSPGPVFDSEHAPEVTHGEVVEETDKKEKKKKSKARNIFEWVFTGLFAVLFIIFGAGQIDGMVHKDENHVNMVRFGFASYVVWTNSMEPVYPVDSAIITYLEDEQTIINRFNNGETVDISFVNAQYFSYGEITPTVKPINAEDDPLANYNTPIQTGRVMTHRLVEIQNKNGINYFILAGINSGGDYSKMGQYQVCTYSYILGVVKVGSPFLGAIYNFISSPWGLLVLLLVPALYLAITSIVDILKTLKEAEEEPKDSGNVNKSTTLEGISKKDKERLKQEMLEEMMNKKKEKQKNEK